MDSGDASSKKSHSMVYSVCEIVLGRKLTDKEKELYVKKYEKPIRKCAHFTLYFLLGISFISLLKEFGLITKKSVIYTILFVFLYACSDEIHQLLVQDRSGQILDVVLDTFGGCVSSVFYYYLWRKFYEQEKTTS